MVFGILHSIWYLKGKNQNKTSVLADEKEKCST
jgi:hypothetical protein